MKKKKEMYENTGIYKLLYWCFNAEKKLRVASKPTKKAIEEIT